MLLDSWHAKLETPFAVLGIRTSGERLSCIEYLPRGVATLAPLNVVAERVCRQLVRYLDDPHFRFNVPFNYVGTDFQCRVWGEISKIASGKTLTYKGVAQRLKSAPRPVGGACGANRIPIIIPCHRVMGSQDIGGFMHARGGVPIDIKRWLLRHEGVRV